MIFVLWGLFMGARHTVHYIDSDDSAMGASAIKAPPEKGG